MSANTHSFEPSALKSERYQCVHMNFFLLDCERYKEPKRKDTVNVRQKLTQNQRKKKKTEQIIAELPQK